MTFILGAALTAAICPAQNPLRRGMLIGVYAAGVSISLLLSGAAIPIILAGGVQHWPEAWVVLGLISAVGLPLAWWAARSVPVSAGGSTAVLTLHELRQLMPTFLGYALFGAGYVGYMTFIIALLQKQGGSSEQVIWFWFVLGLVSAVSTLAVGTGARRLSRRSRAGAGLRDRHAGRAAGSPLPRSDRDVRIRGPVRGQLHGRPDIDHHRGAAPIASRIMDRSPLASDRRLRAGTGRRPDSRGRDFGCDGKYRDRLLGISGSAGGRRLCEPAAASAGGERNRISPITIIIREKTIMSDRKGGCLCGAVRYVLKGEPRSIAICHCTHCQRQSGSLFSFNLVLRESDYKQSGETMIYVDSGDSGHPVYRHFCGRCGSPISVKTALMPGKVVLKAGTLDNVEGLQPKAEIYTDHAVKWLEPITGAQRYAQNV